MLEIEPTLPHTTKSPDFLAENAAQERFYLEAVQASGLSSQDVAARARLSTALAAIDSTPSPLHFLDLSVSGSADQPLSTKKLTTALKLWIASLPADETAKAGIRRSRGAKGSAACHELGWGNRTAFVCHAR